jgi:hypothetical protein
LQALGVSETDIHGSLISYAEMKKTINTMNDGLLIRKVIQQFGTEKTDCPKWKEWKV